MSDLSAIKVKVRSIIEEVAETYFPRDEKVKKCVKTHPISAIVAVTPFLARSKFPERYAVANLSALIAASITSKKYFACLPGEGTMSRLRVLNNFEQPEDTRVIDKAFLILEMFALFDYQQDQADDKAKGKYNPLNDSMDFEKEKARLYAGIRKLATPDLDAFLGFTEPQQYYETTISDLIKKRAIWFCWCLIHDFGAT
jgi:hypothetical protein